MSDIGFLLLIFMMLISLIGRGREAPVEYPEAENAERIGEAASLEIWVDAGGAVFAGGMAVDWAVLESLVAETVAERPETRITVVADRATAYRNVDRVVKVLQRLQHRTVGFAVREAP